MKFPEHIDPTAAAGGFLAVVGIYLGLKIEGIPLADVAQLTAALVVFCGTFGAVLLSTPLAQTRDAIRLVPALFRKEVHNDQELIGQILTFSRVSRVRGLPQLQHDVEQLSDPFLRTAMRLAVDSVGAETISRILESHIHGFRTKAELSASFFETAGGYAPTLGMTGAALGLIHVLKHMSNTELVGTGVAAAFVAIVYGLLLANLVLLPFASKIRVRAEVQNHRHQIVREGVLAICAGLHPSLIRVQLESLAQVAPSASRASGIRAVAA